LFGLGRPTLGLERSLFGFGDAALHLLQALLAPFLLRAQLFQSFCLGSPLFGCLGPLLDLS
jgi:hypothetical protein